MTHKGLLNFELGHISIRIFLSEALSWQLNEKILIEAI